MIAGNYRSSILFQLLWLFVAFLATILSAVTVFGWSPPKATIDLHLHDTFLILPVRTVLLFLFLLFTFFIFFIKECRHQFNDLFSVVILFASGMSLIVYAFFISKTVSGLIAGGWISYPPLAALPQGSWNAVENTVAKVITYTLHLLQLLTGMALCLISFRLGQHSKTGIVETVKDNI